MTDQSFMQAHGGTVIVAIGGAFAALMTWFTTRTSTVSAMQKTLQEGFELLNDQQNEKIGELKACVTELEGKIRQLEQINLSLHALLREHGIEVPHNPKVVTVFMPYPAPEGV